MASQPPGRECGVCRKVADVDLVRLDLLAGDPARWPRTIWQDAGLPGKGGWEPPKGLLPPRYRSWGQFKVASDWLARNGYEDLTENQIRGHLKHIPMVARRPVELAETGLVAGRPVPTPRPVDPNAYLAYYAKGVAAGIRGLELLERRIARLEERGEEVPLDLIKMMVDAGAKLATSQAQIRSRGVKMHEDNDDDAFRRAASPEPEGEATRVGHVRIRTVGGETRPIMDEGRADRTAYNERARKEGNPEIPL